MKCNSLIGRVFRRRYLIVSWFIMFVIYSSIAVSVWVFINSFVWETVASSSVESVNSAIALYKDPFSNTSAWEHGAGRDAVNLCSYDRFGYTQPLLERTNDYPDYFNMFDYSFSYKKAVLIYLRAGFELFIITLFLVVVGNIGYADRYYLFILPLLAYLWGISYLSSFRMFLPLQLLLSVVFILLLSKSFIKHCFSMLFSLVPLLFFLPPHVKLCMNYFTTNLALSYPAFLVFLIWLDAAFIIFIMYLLINNKCFFYNVLLRKVRLRKNDNSTPAFSMSDETILEGSFKYSKDCFLLAIKDAKNNLIEHNHKVLFSDNIFNDALVKTHILWFDPVYAMNKSDEWKNQYTDRLEILVAWGYLQIVRLDRCDFPVRDCSLVSTNGRMIKLINRIASLTNEYDLALTERGPNLLNSIMTHKQQCQNNIIRTDFADLLGNDFEDPCLLKLPYPISDLLLTCFNTEIGTDNAYRLIAAWECIVQYLGIYTVAIAQTPEHSNSKVLKKYNSGRKAPTFGYWENLAITGYKEFADIELANLMNGKLEIDETINSSIRTIRNAFALHSDWGKKLRTVKDLLVLGSAIRNKSIGHGALAYELSEELIHSIAILLSRLIDPIIKIGGIGVNVSNGFTSFKYTGLIPPKMESSSKFTVSCYIGNDVYSTDLIKFALNSGDLLFWNGIYQSIEMWKSYTM